MIYCQDTVKQIAAFVAGQDDEAMAASIRKAFANGTAIVHDPKNKTCPVNGSDGGPHGYVCPIGKPQCTCMYKE